MQGMTWVCVLWTRAGDRGVADALLRELVETRYDRPAGPVSTGRICPVCGSDRHGRPYLRGWTGSAAPAISISRTEGATLVAVSSGGPVGVDVERLCGFPDASVADVLLHPTEGPMTPRELATTWVRKEALLKASGVGLSVDPRTIRLGRADEEPAWFHDLVLADGLRAAVAGTGPEPEEITVRQAGPAGPHG
jgi:4'-phosphopantetheinyl transferase